MTNFESVKKFMETFGQEVKEKAEFPNEKITSLRYDLINEELEELDQIAVKQLKNRYNDPTINKRFVIGVDRAKMKLFDVEDSEQQGLVDSNQRKGADDNFAEAVFDKTDFGDGWKV